MKKPTTLLITIFLVLFTFTSFSQELTLNDIFAGRKLFPKMIRGMTSLADGEHYTRLEHDTINVYSYKTGDVTRTIATASEMIPQWDTVPIPLRSFEFSPDEKMMLIPTKTEHIYRYSSASNYYVWDLQKKKLSALSTEGKQRLAEFSPDGTMIIFVRDNDLFMKNIEQDTEIRITQDGEVNNIINGTTDWVYEEEFAITKGYEWSPDSKKIAFMRFDESRVKEFWMTTWGSLYPEHHKFKYPKAGEDNSLVTIHIYDISTGSITHVDLGPETDQYIPRIYWTKNPDVLAVFRVNRLQNKFDILLTNAATGETKIIYAENNKYYIDESHYDHVLFIDDEHYLMTSERDGYYHIYLNNLNGTRGRQLTYGDWDVTDLIGYDDENQLVYFVAAGESPINREIYSVNLDGKKKKVSKHEGWNRPRFSANYEYFVNSFSQANAPPVYTVHRSNGKKVRVLEDNAALLKSMDEYNFSSKEFFTFTTSEGVELNGWKILPPGFNPENSYPLFMYVYGGPGSQTVTNSWGYSNFLWFEYLALQGYIVASVDNRGTGARGEEFKKMTYLELGKYETIDQIEAAKYFAGLDYVDSSRIGIWGWSYGGFLSTLCITKGADHFSTAVAVAPVTNWRYYDNIYTERFMRTPQENPDGYDDNSPINYVDLLEGKYLVIHGTGDDNVHVQNTMDLLTALEKANKQFEMRLYPNKNHGIYGGKTRLNLYTRITDFILGNL